MKMNVLLLGASGDIGSVTATNLAKEGYGLILHYHQNQTAIEQLMTTLDVSILQNIQADLADMNDVHRLCQAVHFPVHAIVYVSGTAHIGLFQDALEEDMDQMLHLHVKAPWFITQYFLPEMIRQRAGNIILITSIWGNIGASNEVIYSSVKGAQNSFVRALAKEVGPSGISVNAVSPGFIQTKMNQHLLQDEMEAIIAEIPLHRAGVAADVSHAVEFLLDEKSNYIQGEILNISGGW